MKTLLTEVFSRMDGSNPDANGAFLLSQSMGGGKTHNLLALGLLAREPALREPVMGGFYNVKPLGPIKVVTFSGRERPDYGIWGYIAEQLGKPEVFSKFYSPLRAPGQSNWVELLQGEPTLILIDELPPYLNAALQESLGQSTMAHATQTALSNLLSAINSGKLPNVTLVLTDLSGTAYQNVDDRLPGLLSDLEKEAERTVQSIQPVRLDTPELYDILRTRLFKHLPDEQAIDNVAAAFRTAIEEAGRALDVPADRASDLQTGIRRTYPFHPAMQDIFARFRENQGYQQTRALIRIMRQVIAGMWESGLAAHRYLIGVQDVDTSNPRLASELDKINDRFSNAIAHDVSNATGTAVAQQIDGKDGRNAQDAARLILMSSLSLATNPVLGLTRADIISFLASPNRKVSDLNDALARLTEEAWYLHATADGRLLFRTTENVRARLATAAKNVSRSGIEAEIAKRLTKLYTPITRDVYQEVVALPDLRDVAITQDRTTLIIARPEAPGSTLLEDYYASLNFKNRVLFVTSRPDEFATAIDRMRNHMAASSMVTEFGREGYRPDDPQLIEARDLSTRFEANFYQALRQAFFTLLSPGTRGLVRREFDPKYESNQFEGETVIRQALTEHRQYVPPADMMTDAFRERIERQLWPAEVKAVAWAQIRAEAAQQPGFPMHQPGKLDDVRDQAVQRGQWRLIDDGRFVERGPFEKEKARVSTPRVIGEPDRETGAVTLEVKPIKADRVTYIGPDGSRQVVQGGQITVADLTGTFVAEDTSGEHQPDEPLQWKNTIAIRYDVHQDGAGRRLVLKAVPKAAMRYTVDGSSPLNNGLPYTGPVAITNDATVVRAIAEAQGVRATLDETIPAVAGDQRVTVDERKPAVWKRKLTTATTAETYELLRLLDERGARLAGAELTADSREHYAMWQVDAELELRAAQVREVADLLTSMHQGWALRMEVKRTCYPTGSDLLDVVRERQTEIKPNELEQHG